MTWRRWREKKNLESNNKSNTLYTFLQRGSKLFDNNSKYSKIKKKKKMDMYRGVFNGLLRWIIQVDVVQWE